MRVFTFVEVDIDRCQHVYGTAPCTASVGVTGTIKCFNSKKTCQDRANFSDVPVTLRFARPTDGLPKDIEYIPSIKSVSFTPAVLSLGENLGQRAVLNVAFEDHPSADTGTGGDPYLSERDYSPFTQGTFWGKFRARHPFVRGMPIRLITMQEGQTFETAETRHYVADSFDGPTLQGEFTLVAKDVLKFADGDRAQAPRVSSGFLSAAIDTDDTTATLSPSGIGDEEYAASGYLLIGGSEICAFTRTGNSLTLTRGQLGTTAKSHSQEDRCQTVLIYDADDVADIIADLLQSYAGVPSDYIPIAQWQAETSTFFGRLFSAIIANPTSVSQLISEIVQQAALALWWDDQSRKIGLQVLRSLQASEPTFRPANILEGTLKIKEQPDRRVSRVQVYFGIINPVTSLSDVQNYRSVAEVRDDGAEEDYGAVVIKTIYSRWIPAFGRSAARRLGTIQLARFRDPPRKVSFSVLRTAIETAPLLAGSHFIESPSIQDATGLGVSLQVQNTKINPKVDRYEVEAQESGFAAPEEDLSTRQIIIDANTNNVNLRAAHDLNYPPAQSGEEVICTIQEGVIVGSTSVSLPAFDVGSWPAGVIVKLVNHGRIQGAGGRGANFSAGNGASGEAGGTALYARSEIDLDEVGEIFGGGGAGGAGGGNVEHTIYGGPGGGGAGQLPGQPGAGAGYGNGFGTAGTTEVGGTPGQGSFGFASGISVWLYGGAGGAGGGPGLPGASGVSGVGSNGQSFASGGPGGAAGVAIDGDSFITKGVAGDIRGTQIN